MFNCGFKYFDINVNNTLTIVFVINISLYYDLTHSSNAIATFLADNFSLFCNNSLSNLNILQLKELTNLKHYYLIYQLPCSLQASW